LYAVPPTSCVCVRVLDSWNVNCEDFVTLNVRWLCTILNVYRMYSHLIVVYAAALNYVLFMERCI
jgi:hypothetical protein